MELDVVHNDAAMGVGSYFVANYPPFSAWAAEHVPAALAALDSRPADPAPLGLYLHIPFCRKRCKFCYYRVYTDKNSRQVGAYLDALAREVALYAALPALRDRDLEFVYFGGGTPSFLSSDQLRGLIDRINERWTWDRAREVTFECEPGTLRKGKLQAIKAIGTTRLSLGVEHFDDQVLSINGRAHKSPEVFRAYDWAREVGFDQINIDLIAGMLGDTEAKWQETVDRALALEADCVTIYQMELPPNSVIARQARESGEPPELAGWATRQARVAYAFDRFEQAGYVISSAYTLSKPNQTSCFVYRDAVWHGADMIGAGVASFSHLAGVHSQNVDQWEDYLELLDRGKLPLGRALPMTTGQRLTRELILQLKLGRIDAGYFRGKFDVEIGDLFRESLQILVDRGVARIDGDEITLSREGLLQVDALLPAFFEPPFRNVLNS
ncbi:MAG: coproporphyrinogen III oxidase family protein [bacterium]|nr:coproporphyrinogen III oxidase family protein [bacterium]